MKGYLSDFSFGKSRGDDVKAQASKVKKTSKMFVYCQNKRTPGTIIVYLFMLSFPQHKKLSWLSAVSIASIGALLCFQAYWLYNSYNNTYNKFVSDAQEALQEACDTIQAQNKRNVEQQAIQDSSGSSSSIITILKKSPLPDSITATRVSVLTIPSVALEQLDKVFRQTLANRGLNHINYVLEIKSMGTTEKRSLGIHKPGREVKIGANNLQLTSFDYGQRLNINMSKEHVSAYLQFTPLAIFKQMMWTLAVSALLFLIILYCMTAQLRVILRQKTAAKIKDDFIANFTHELKTPIAVVYAALDNIERRPELREEAVSVGKSQLKRLSDSVEKILSLSVEEQGRIELHREETPMYDWVTLLIEPFRLKTEKEVTFELTVDPTDAKANIDRIHFANALNNIIDNAIKYSEEQVHIGIDCSRTMQGLCIAIRDNGFGIAPDDVKKIFDRFYRVETTAGRIKGFGLGLNYAQTIVEMHGGTIRAESVLGKGSTFIIEL